MYFEHQTFWLAKDADRPESYQDAFALDGQRGRAAIADGVSETLFASRWAKVLVEACVKNPPHGNPIPGPADWSAWLDPLRWRWTASIDAEALAWHQRPKLQAGALSTLLWIELARDHSSGALLDCRAVGDSCLLHVREGRLLRSFPLENSHAFTDAPCALSSIDRRRDGQLEVKHYRSRCRPGDLLVLCTDSLAAWALRRYETGSAPDWLGWWPLPAGEWQQAMLELRRRGDLRQDDTTALLLRVSGG